METFFDETNYLYEELNLQRGDYLLRKFIENIVVDVGIFLWQELT